WECCSAPRSSPPPAWSSSSSAIAAERATCSDFNWSFDLGLHGWRRLRTMRLAHQLGLALGLARRHVDLLQQSPTAGVIDRDACVARIVRLEARRELALILLLALEDPAQVLG